MWRIGGEQLSKGVVGSVKPLLAAAVEHERAVALGARRGLGGQSGLADPGLSGQGGHRGRPGARGRERLGDGVQLRVAPDEGPLLRGGPQARRKARAVEECSRRDELDPDKRSRRLSL